MGGVLQSGVLDWTWSKKWSKAWANGEGEGCGKKLERKVECKVQSEVDTGVELARFREWFSRPPTEVCAFLSLLLFYPTPVLDSAWPAFVGLGSPLKLASGCCGPARERSRT